MDSIQVKITFSKYAFQGVAMSVPLMEQLGLKPKQKIELWLGERSIAVPVLRGSKGENQLWLPAYVREKLLVPFEGYLHLFKSDNKIMLGPVIGILTTGIGKGSEQPLSPRAGFFKHLLSAQKGEGVYYFLFTPADVSWENKAVNGYFLRQINGRVEWKRHWIPFPNVIYNRIPNRSTESQPLIQQFKRNVMQYTGARMFNPNFFDKWSIHEKLVNHPDTQSHVPETYLSPNIDTIDQMLRRYGMVYLKPAGGSLGLGIVRVTLHPKHGYLCRYHTEHGNVLKRFSSLSGLLNHVFTGRRKLSRYLIQQGISLMKIEGRPVDFRVHLHKNRHNQWVVTAIAAKAAGHGSVTTHVRTGGTVLSSLEALRYVFGSQAEVIYNEITSVSVKLAETIEATLDHDLGELGFDIGVDQKGHIWMFEANSKPGRSIFKHPSLKQADRESIRYILDYSYYLAGLNGSPPGYEQKEVKG